MQTIKIVQKFFTEKEAIKAISYQRAQAKKQGKLIARIEKIEAHKFFVRNGWVKKSPFAALGLPQSVDFMVVVYYTVGKDASAKEKLVQKRIIRAKKKKNTAEKFFIVRLTEHQIQSITPTAFKFVSNTTFPVTRFRYTAAKSKKSAAKIIVLDVNISLAA